MTLTSTPRRDARLVGLAAWHYNYYGTVPVIDHASHRPLPLSLTHASSAASHPLPTTNATVAARVNLGPGS